MIGGNIIATIQESKVSTNSIGENIQVWTDKYSIKGFLDYVSGDSKYLTYSAKVQESTHLFICDYFQIDITISENTRMIINQKVYDILLIDNPMEINKHLEIYLKFVGGQ